MTTLFLISEVEAIFVARVCAKGAIPSTPGNKKGAMSGASVESDQTRK